MNKNEIFAENLKAGAYDSEINQMLLDWQVGNAQSRIKDFADNLTGAYDGEKLSTAPISQQHIDELLMLGRELHQDNRRTYLKANLDQYIHDLGYVVNPTIHITEAEWDNIRSGHISSLAVLRDWSASKIESIIVDEAESIEDAPIKRTRKHKNEEA